MLAKNNDWVYFKVFLDVSKSTQLDSELSRFMLDVIEPLGCFYDDLSIYKQWFFMQYIEGGFHFRIRFFTKNQEHNQAILQCFQELYEQYLVVQDSSLPLLRTQVDEYQPELDKYGGEISTDLVEKHFTESSLVALEIITITTPANKNTNKAKVKKEQISLWILHQTFLGLGMSDKETIAVLKGYSLFWSNQIAGYFTDIETTLENNYQKRKDSLHLFLSDDSRFVESCDLLLECKNKWLLSVNSLISDIKQLEQSSQIQSSLLNKLLSQGETIENLNNVSLYPYAFLALLPNIIHMLNNRIGVDVLQEIQLAYMLFRQMEDRSNLKVESIEMLLE